MANSTEFSWYPSNAEEYRRWWAEHTEVPYEFCWCGCGQKTKLAPTTSTMLPRVRNEPYRYVSGHQKRLQGAEYVEDPSTGCWVWQRGTTFYGYGQMRHNGRAYHAHKVIYERRYGALPRGVQLHHQCEEDGYGIGKHCVNPDHLEPLSGKEHALRGSQVKLDPEAARSIRELYASGGYSYSKLAKQFDVAECTIGSIVRRQSWTDV